MGARPGKNALQIGEWIADPDDGSLTRGAESSRVDPRAMQLLLRLARSPGEVVSQGMLLEDVWRGVVVSPASVYQTISQLRKALGDTDSPPSYIETIARKGYRLVARVHPLAPSIPSTDVPSQDPPRADVATPAASEVNPPPPRRSRWWIAAALALLAAGGGWFWLHAQAAQADSIVVLPFDDMTTDESEAAFCEGMTEELSNWLAQVPGLRVVARTSAIAIHEKGLDVREIGAQLGATHVLEGSLRREGNMLRVTVQLIDARTGFHAWSRNYDIVRDNALLTQEQIGRQVAEVLQLQLTLETSELFAQRRSENPQAYLAYVLASAHQRRATPDDNTQAIALYEQALAIDPKFPLAQVGLVTAYLNQNQFEDWPLAEIDLHVAPLIADLEKDAPDFAEFRIARAMWRNDHRDHAGAIADLKRALEIEPDSSKAAAKLGYVYLTMGEPRAAESQFQAAALFDPFNATVQSLWCMSLTDLGEFTAARERCDRAHAIEPNSQSALSAISELEVARGNIATALEWNAVALHGSDAVGELHSDRGRWLMRMGLVQEARRAYREAIVATGDAGLQNVGIATLGLCSTLAVEGPAAARSLITRSHMNETNDPQLLFQLAEIELMMNDASAARGYVDKALASPEFEPQMLADPWDARTGRSLLLIAAAAARGTEDEALAKRYLDDADQLIEQLVAAGMRRNDVFLIRAGIAAMRGDADAAMRALETAEELGWRYVWLVEHVPYFDALRDRAEYRALIARISARNATDGARVLAVLAAPRHGAS